MTEPAPVQYEYKKPYFWIAVWFGCGLSPKAPGTVGSLGALPLAIMVFVYGGLLPSIIGLLIVTMIGYLASVRFEQATETHDSKMIVVDEVVGQWISLLPVFILFDLNTYMIALSFILFRFFDVLKPWPVSFFDQKVGGAVGVMADDVMAGILAAILIIGAYYAGLG